MDESDISSHIRTHGATHSTLSGEEIRARTQTRDALRRRKVTAAACALILIGGVAAIVVARQEPSTVDDALQTSVVPETSVVDLAGCDGPPGGVATLVMDLRLMNAAPQQCGAVFDVGLDDESPWSLCWSICNDGAAVASYELVGERDGEPGSSVFVVNVMYEAEGDVEITRRELLTVSQEREGPVSAVRIEADFRLLDDEVAFEQASLLVQAFNTSDFTLAATILAGDYVEGDDIPEFLDRVLSGRPMSDLSVALADWCASSAVCEGGVIRWLTPEMTESSLIGVSFGASAEVSAESVFTAYFWEGEVLLHGLPNERTND